MRIVLENYNAGTFHSYYKTHHYYCRPLVVEFRGHLMVKT